MEETTDKPADPTPPAPKKAAKKKAPAKAKPKAKKAAKPKAKTKKPAKRKATSKPAKAKKPAKKGKAKKPGPNKGVYQGELTHRFDMRVTAKDRKKLEAVAKRKGQTITGVVLGLIQKLK